jgi:BON domain
VNSQKGVVVLTGSVGTDLEKGATERLANEAKGVKQVIDQLAISATTAQVAAPATPAESAPQESAAVPKPHHRARRAPRPEAPSHAAPVPARAAPQSAVAQPAPVVEAAPERPPAPLQATIPAGSVITVRMIDSIDSSRNHAGDEFDATVNSPVVAGDRVAIPQGSNARVRLVEAKTAGHMTGRSELQLELVSLTVNATTYNVESGTYQLQGASRGKRTAETVGGGAGLGALIGAIAGRGKGAAIGAGIGAAAGAGAQAITKGQQVKIPSETKIDFTLKAPLAVTLTH